MARVDISIDRQRRRPLDRERILAEAVVFIDEHGLQALTMRRLGAHLGVEAMALYRYVPGREQLLDGVVDRLMDKLYDDTMLGAHSRSWREYLHRLAHGVRDLAVAHPRIFPLVVSRPPPAPWLRPPLRSLRWVDEFLGALREYQFSDQAAVTVYRTFATYLLGQLLLEVATITGDPAMVPNQSLGGNSGQDLADYPNVTSLESLLRADSFDEEFDDSLEELITRMALLHT